MGLRGGRGRAAPHALPRSAGGGEDDAGRAGAGPAARPGRCRRARGVGRALARRLRPGRRADHPAAVQRSAPLGIGCQHRRRGTADGQTRARSPAPIGECSSWTRRPSSRRRCIEALRTPLESGTISSAAARSRPAIRPNSSSSWRPTRAPAGRRPRRAPSASARRWRSGATPRRSRDPIRDRIDIAQGFLPLRRAQLGRRWGGRGVVGRGGRPRVGRGPGPADAAGWPGRDGGPTARSPDRTCGAACRCRTAAHRRRRRSTVVGSVRGVSTRCSGWPGRVADLAGRDRPGRDDTAVALAMRRGEQPGTVAAGGRMRPRADRPGGADGAGVCHGRR